MENLTLEQIMVLGGAVYAIASVVVKLTPSPKDDEWLRKIVKFFGFMKSSDQSGILKRPLSKGE